MGKAASGARGVPDPAAGPGPGFDQSWDALERLKYSHGAQWTDEMASIVGHHSRHNWGLAPRRGETCHRWDIRVDATYYYYHDTMVQWLNKPFPVAPKVYFFRGGNDLLFLEAKLYILEVV